MKHKGCSILLTLTVAMLATVAARGDIPVELSFVSFGPGFDTGVDTFSGTPYEATRGADAGVYKHHVNDPSGLVVTNFPDPTPMFCLDIVQLPEQADGVYVTYYLVDPADGPQPDDLGHASYPMHETRAAWLTLLAQEYWNATELVTDADYAAMQLAIWEIVFEGTNADVPTTGSANAADSFWQVTYEEDNSDDFYAGADDADVLARADEMLQSIWTLVGDNPVQRSEATFLGALVNDTYQDMLVVTERRVPEPTGLALAALGLLGLVTRRKRRS